MVIGVSTPAAVAFSAAAVAAALPASDPLLERAGSIFDSIGPRVMSSHNTVIDAIKILCGLRETVLSRLVPEVLRGLSLQTLRSLEVTADQASTIELASHIQEFIDRLCEGSRIDFSTAKFSAGTHKEAIRAAELGLGIIGGVQADFDVDFPGGGRFVAPTAKSVISGINDSLTKVDNALSPSFGYVTDIDRFGTLNHFDEEYKLVYFAAAMRTFEAAARVFARVDTLFSDVALSDDTVLIAAGRGDIVALKGRVRDLTDILHQKITVIRGYHPIVAMRAAAPPVETAPAVAPAAAGAGADQNAVFNDITFEDF